MRYALIALMLAALAGCGKREDTKPPAIERITNGSETCWRVVSDNGWTKTEWKCEKAN